MTHSDRLRIMTIAICAVLVCLTALAMYVTYGSRVFVKMPWIRFSLVLSILTCLWAYLFWFYRLAGGTGTNRRKKEIAFNSAGFAIMVIPLDVVLAHPGLSALGGADSPDYTAFLLILVLTHGIGFYFMQTEIQEFLNK